MRDEKAPAAGLEAFWEQADSDALCEHPLERELCHRLDALNRYREMIMDAQSSGREEVVDALAAQFERQARLVELLKAALSGSRIGDRGSRIESRAAEERNARFEVEPDPL
jgi:hypothetical protein